MKTTDFKEFCAKAKKIVGKSSLPILDYVLIKAGSLTVSDLEITLIQEIEGLKDLPAFTLNFKDFSQILDKLKDTEISFDVKDEFIISLVSKKGVFNLTGCDPLDYPRNPEGFENSEFDYLSLKDIKLIKKAVNYVAKDELRPVMNTVFISDHIVGSDSHRLAFYKREGFKNEFMIPAKVIDLIDEKSEISVFGSEYNLKFVSDKFTLLYRKIEGEYPKYKRVIPTEFKSFFNIDASQLSEILDLALLSANKSSGLVRLQNDTDLQTLQISSRDIDYGKSFLHTVEVENSGEFIEFGAKIQFLQSIIKTEKMNVCTFKLSDASRAFIINDEVLLMPMEIK